MPFTWLNKTLAVITALVLLGCSGEADEAQKLGFSSVPEMKEVQAKGWHTQQKYYEDNPQIAKDAEERRLTVEREAAESKAAEARIISEKLKTKNIIESKPTTPPVEVESRSDEPILIDSLKDIEQVCSKISGMTQGLVSLSATNWQTSMRNIGFIGAYNRKDGGCRISVDTPNGPQDCIVGRVVESHGKYLAHTMNMQMSMVCGY
ncbi:hypothetical protein [Rhodoferax fermentans]|uniref:hypothetical protein n=1 Tax=Rhodoferax fermentans TaxID=28066 RepID=UPI00117ABA29|nr:hypothetical protein [Rhodoferax fermentans]